MSAGVSHQTVWRAIHGAPGISPQTRIAVLDIASKLNYRRNGIAGSLRTLQSSTIGLIVLDVRNSHAGELASGVEEEAASRDLSVLLANTGGDPQREQAAVHMLVERRVDGIIIWPSESGQQDYLHTMLPADFPVVAVNRRAIGYRCQSVLSRDEDAGLAARFLMTRGARAVGGIFGHLGVAPFRGRHRAFVDALAKAKRAIAPQWIKSGDNTVDFGYRATLEMFDGPRRPDALFTAGSLLTEGALRGLKDAGIRCGRDVTLIGYDLRYAALLDPPLPVLLQPAREMGRLALDLVVKELRQGAAGQRAGGQGAAGRAGVRRLPVEISHG